MEDLFIARGVIVLCLVAGILAYWVLRED